MAANDFAAQNGTEKLSTNALTTVNGTNVTADLIEVQRMKIGFGGDGVLNDVTSSVQMPVTQPDVTASGTVLLLNDAVPIVLNGDGSWAIDLSGFAGHVVTFESQVNSGSTWRAINGALQGVGTLSSLASADGIYRGAAASLVGIRARLSTVGTGMVTVSIRASISSAGVFQMSPTPTGSNLIGYIEGTAGALLARDGTDITTPTAMPAGGVGIRGWLSSIWTKLNGTIAVTGAFFQATQPVSLATNTPTIAAGTAIIGKVGIDQTTGGTSNGVQINALTYPQSTGNNSTAQLAASATFTGSIETVLSLQAAQIEVVCDQPYTVFIDQFIDAAGTKLSSTYIFTRLAGVPTNENVTLPGNYMRVRVQNTGAATTTTFQLDTTFGIMNTQPNTLSQFGNFKTVAQENGVVSTVNSTTTNLAASSVFTGTSEDVSEFSMVMVTVFSSHTSATDGLSVEQSTNGTNWDLTDTFTIPAATGKTFSFGVAAKFYRLVYTNGATLTTSLRIQSLFSRTFKKSSSQRPQDGRTNDNDFEETLAYLMGYNGATWERVRTKPASTAAAFSDIALVADIRPGGVLPVAAATTDALANPTVSNITAHGALYNGTTWDRMRGMSIATTTGDTGAKIATGNGATQTNVGNKGIAIVIILGTVSGTTPTCVFKLQNSVDSGTTWLDVPGAASASLVATGNFGISVYPGQVVTAGTTTTNTTTTANGVLARSWRVVWTIGGTTPSFSITSITYNYLPN